MGKFASGLSVGYLTYIFGLRVFLIISLMYSVQRLHL